MNHHQTNLDTYNIKVTNSSSPPPPPPYHLCPQRSVPHSPIPTQQWLMQYSLVPLGPEGEEHVMSLQNRIDTLVCTRHLESVVNKRRPHPHVHTAMSRCVKHTNHNGGSGCVIIPSSPALSNVRALGLLTHLIVGGYNENKKKAVGVASLCVV